MYLKRQEDSTAEGFESHVHEECGIMERKPNCVTAAVQGVPAEQPCAPELSQEQDSTHG